MVQPPTLQALILADLIHRDPGTHKVFILGTFNTLHADTFPTTFGRPVFAYVCLTNVRGAMELDLRYVDLNSNELLMRSESVEVPSDNPLASVELVVPVPPFPMPRVGVYAFEVHVGDEMIGSYRITVQGPGEGSQS